MKITDLNSDVLFNVFQELEIYEIVSLCRVSSKFEDVKKDFWASKRSLSEHELRSLFEIIPKSMPEEIQVKILLKIVSNMPTLKKIVITGIPREVRDLFLIQLKNVSKNISTFEWSRDKTGLMEHLIPEDDDFGALFQYYVDFGLDLIEIPRHVLRGMKNFLPDHIKAYIDYPEVIWNRFWIYWYLTRYAKSMRQINRQFLDPFIETYLNNCSQSIKDNNHSHRSRYASLVIDNFPNEEEEFKIAIYKQTVSDIVEVTGQRSSLDLSRLTILKLKIKNENRFMLEMFSKVSNVQEVELELSGSSVISKVLDLLSDLPKLDSISITAHSEIEWQDNEIQSMKKILIKKSKHLKQLIVNYGYNEELLKLVLDLDWPKIQTFYLSRILFSGHVLILHCHGGQAVEWTFGSIKPIFGTFKKWKYLEIKFEGNSWIQDVVDFVDKKPNKMFKIRSKDKMNIQGNNYAISHEQEWPVERVLPYL